MVNTKNEEQPELFELNVDVSWVIFVQHDKMREKIENIRVVPVVYNKDGTRFKDLRTNKIYETGLPKQNNPKMAVMQRMCAMVEPNKGDKTLMWEYMYAFEIENCEQIKQRLTKCNGQNHCQYNFVNISEHPVEHFQMQNMPGCVLEKDGKITLNAVDELLFTREELVGLADSMEKQYKAPERKTKSKEDVLNF